MAALDPQIVDPLRQVENAIPPDSQVKEGVQPFAAGIEARDGSLIRALFDFYIPGTKTLALKARPQGYTVLVKSSIMVWGDFGATPIVIIQCAPGCP